MRSDALGFFWRDEPAFKKLKLDGGKRTPPERTWEAADYLPHFDRASTYVANLFTDAELIAAVGCQLEYDIECYPNYFLCAFIHRESGKIVYFEKYCDGYMDVAKLRWVMENFEIVGFNSHNYDEVMATLAIAGRSNQQLKRASDEIIVGQLPGYEVLRMYKCKKLKGLNHIDLIEVAPSFCTLKLYAGRMHSRSMQDLPFNPAVQLTPDQVTVLRWYCFQDLDHTNELKVYLREALDLRRRMSVEYETDLRSKSDAQIAESVIAYEMKRITGKRPTKTEVLPGTVYYYQPPSYMNFQTVNLQWVLNTLIQTPLIVSEFGKIMLPDNLKELLIPIGNSRYQMGIGGLHSTEKRTAHVATDELDIIDRDVESYYPRIMINLGLYPPHLGPPFLQAFGGIVDRRLEAKHRKDKPTAKSLKITVNGTYGKLGSSYSFLHAPHQVTQVTLTGQLALLMVIERLELAGFQVVSANTDGLVTRVPKVRYAEFDAIFKRWEADTNLKTEETRYKALYSKDVNNYIALKESGGYKGKGVYANPWDPADPDLDEQLKHNPTHLIALEAALAQLMHGTPIPKTVRGCTDVRKFISVRKIAGGAVHVCGRAVPEHSTKAELLIKSGFSQTVGGWWRHRDWASELSVTSEEDGYNAAIRMWPAARQDYLGKSIRWYYASGEHGEIISAKTGHKVPRSDGAKPMMELPDTLPNDIDYEWYEKEGYKILKLIGYSDM